SAIVYGVSDSGNAQADHARPGESRRPRQLGGRCARQIRGEFAATMSSTKAHFATIKEAIEDIRRGRMVVVVDDENRENEGDLTIAAQFVTPEAINFMTKEGRG